MIKRPTLFLLALACLGSNSQAYVKNHSRDFNLASQLNEKARSVELLNQSVYTTTVPMMGDPSQGQTEPDLPIMPRIKSTPARFRVTPACEPVANAIVYHGVNGFFELADADPELVISCVSAAPIQNIYD